MPTDQAGALAYKGLDTMPTWFVVVAVALTALGIALAVRRGRR